MTAVVDADLQGPPEVVPATVRAWQEGRDAAQMRRRARARESRLKRAAAR